MKEQIQIVAASKAWAKFRSIPSVQQLWQMVEAQLKNPSSPAAVVKALLNAPENKQLLQLFGDMFSSEVVVYGDQNWLGFYDITMNLLNVMNTAPLAALASGDDPNVFMMRQMFQTLSKNLDLIEVPTTVVAFKLSATVPAETQLKRLEVLTRLALAEFAKEEPKLKNVLENAIVRTKIGGVDYLTFTLDGKHVPWDEIPFDRIEKKKGQFDKLVAKLKSLKIVVSLGVRDDYLLLSIGGSNEHLARFGKGKLLVDRKEFAPYRKMATRRICSIAYISEAFMQRIAYGTNDIDGLVQLANQALPLANLDAKIEKEIRVDLRKLATQFKDSIPKPGATLTFSFLTNKGYEGYS
ncbi:MAG: hypothetical protein IH991_23585, partial [Planctomycetes bacterium]|nr:hypothetical protein [Planctomycetota bacterium]